MIDAGETPTDLLALEMLLEDFREWPGLEEDATSAATAGPPATRRRQLGGGHPRHRARQRPGGPGGGRVRGGRVPEMDGNPFGSWCCTVPAVPIFITIAALSIMFVNPRVTRRRLAKGFAMREKTRPKTYHAYVCSIGCYRIIRKHVRSSFRRRRRAPPHPLDSPPTTAPTLDRDTRREPRTSPPRPRGTRTHPRRAQVLILLGVVGERRAVQARARAEGTPTEPVGFEPRFLVRAPPPPPPPAPPRPPSPPGP